MHEMQHVLDRSLERASRFTQSLFADERWDAERVTSFVNSQRNMTIASVTPNGDPHAAVVIAACLDGNLHFTVHADSLLHRCIEARAVIAFSICDAAHAVMGRGAAVLVGTSLAAPDLVQRLASVTAVGVFTPPDWDGFIFRIALERLFAS